MKKNITVMSFDLSSKCIGVIAAKIKDGELIKVMSCPIIPKGIDSSELGYLKSKKKLPTSKGEMLSCYAKPGETTITKKEKKQRDVEVRKADNIYKLKYIGNKISYLVDALQPDLIIVEMNEIFNGVLTSVLLGKVMGVLVGIAGEKDIDIKEYKVTQARSVLPVMELVKTFTSGKKADELANIPDITKRALRSEMERLYRQYGLVCSTDDESDACVVFHYWFSNEYKSSLHC